MNKSEKEEMNSPSFDQTLKQILAIAKMNPYYIKSDLLPTANIVTTA